MDRSESVQRFSPVDGTVKIDLPGLTIDVSSDNPGALFDRDYPDLETLLAAHRFAWVPLAGPGVDIGWINTIWEAWIGRYNTDRNGWPWHAYTAAERAINIIDFADRFGLPGNREDTVQSLAGHAESIRNNLEYFGEHYTSNHLSNNGRGLLRIGVALGIEEYAEDGAKIMIAEAGRIFGRSGLLNEGSSHYHLLVTRNYIDAWLAADKAGIEHAPVLKDIAERAVAAVSGLCLPGGMPLIGDISPDAPPAYFAFLTGAETDDGLAVNDERRIPDCGHRPGLSCYARFSRSPLRRRLAPFRGRRLAGARLRSPGWLAAYARPRTSRSRKFRTA